MNFLRRHPEPADCVNENCTVRGVIQHDICFWGWSDRYCGRKGSGGVVDDEMHILEFILEKCSDKISRDLQYAWQIQTC